MDRTHFKSIEASSMEYFKEKGSKFLSYACPAKDIKDIEVHLTNIQKKHPKANHHCYAYRLGNDGLLFRSFDDGEPSGTAGRPILSQIDHLELTNILVVVVRYFGGILLGVGGLARAYRTAARAVLEKAQITKYEIQLSWVLEFRYEIMGTLMHALDQLTIQIAEKSLNESPSMIIYTPKARSEELLDLLLAKTLKIPREAVKGQREFYTISIIAHKKLKEGKDG